MAEFTYDHVHLRSPDPDQTAAYYERMFGAKIIKSVMSNGIELHVGALDAVRHHRFDDLGAEHPLVIGGGLIRVRAAEMDVVVGEFSHGVLPIERDSAIIVSLRAK